MILTLDNLSFHINCKEQDLTQKHPIVFLHGFTGCSEDWQFLNNKIPETFTPVFIDLLGHGKSSSPNDPNLYSTISQIQLLHKIFKKLSINRFVLLGYSMGGRLAINYTLNYPLNVISIILESTSFGIESEEDRKARINSDNKLIEMLKIMRIDEFIKYWMSIPLFKSLSEMPSESISRLKERKIASNNNIGLINSLLGFSTGKMEFLFPYLNRISTSTLLISGRNDSKFSKISMDAHELLPNSNLEIVNKSGHIVHFENPEEFLKLINKFLLNTRESK